MNKNLLLSLLLTSLASCDSEELINKRKAEYAGAIEATAYVKEFYKPYLDCYALDPENKKQCLDKLSYIFAEDVKAIDGYVQGFTHACERLGFQYFINDLGLPCEKIDKGVMFEHQRNAYKVQCISGEQYYMRFDYKNNIWSLVEQ